MRVLVTGAAGFVGRHLTDELTRHGHQPILLDRNPPPDSPFPFVVADINDADALRRSIAAHHPEACVHLAGIAFVPVGWQDPELVFRVNLLGTLNLLESIRFEAPRCRTLIVSSAEIYGHEDPGYPLGEDSPLQPQNPYAVSKAAADLSALLYARHHGLAVMTARPANHCGPGQSHKFVVASFARQLAEIKLGLQPPQMSVGNLESERTFTDVRDVCRAYRLLIEKGSPGNPYNVSVPQRVKISYVLQTLVTVAGVSPRLEVDPERFRPTDSRPLLDTGRITKDTGWLPEYSLEQTLRDVFEYELQQLKK